MTARPIVSAYNGVVLYVVFHILRLITNPECKLTPKIRKPAITNRPKLVYWVARQGVHCFTDVNLVQVGVLHALLQDRRTCRDEVPTAGGCVEALVKGIQLPRYSKDVTEL